MLTALFLTVWRVVNNVLPSVSNVVMPVALQATMDPKKFLRDNVETAAINEIDRLISIRNLHPSVKDELGHVLQDVLNAHPDVPLAIPVVPANQPVGVTQAVLSQSTADFQTLLQNHTRATDEKIAAINSSMQSTMNKILLAVAPKPESVPELSKPYNPLTMRND